MAAGRVWVSPQGPNTQHPAGPPPRPPCLPLAEPTETDKQGLSFLLFHLSSFPVAYMQNFFKEVKAAWGVVRYPGKLIMCQRATSHPFCQHLREGTAFVAGPPWGEAALGRAEQGLRTDLPTLVTRAVPAAQAGARVHGGYRRQHAGGSHFSSRARTQMAWDSATGGWAAAPHLPTAPPSLQCAREEVPVRLRTPLEAEQGWVGASEEESRARFRGRQSVWAWVLLMHSLDPGRALRVPSALGAATSWSPGLRSLLTPEPWGAGRCCDWTHRAPPLPPASPSRAVRVALLRTVLVPLMALGLSSGIRQPQIQIGHEPREGGALLRVTQPISGKRSHEARLGDSGAASHLS